MELRRKHSSKSVRPFNRDSSGRRLADLIAELEDLEVKVFLLEERIDGLELAPLDAGKSQAVEAEAQGPG